ncbi:hypothetical protein [Sphingomonas sp.]|uniref:hypothetical protein n=1 Tax=Sphingomonas sp. TaxID=28214 RepID=UPI001DD54D61|nr:hypothetical protein [Sphingomonas sp.]MBX9795468.1 hypothetical protein [Sphingomonas sp.]
MTPIEERVENALDELEGLLAEGVAADVAIVQAASFYGLKVDVLRVRASKALGDLEAVRNRYSNLKIKNERERQLKRCVQDYVDQFFDDHPRSALPDIPIGNWINKQFGDDIRDRDIALAAARVQIASHRKRIRGLNAQNK